MKIIIVLLQQYKFISVFALCVEALTFWRILFPYELTNLIFKNCIKKRTFYKSFGLSAGPHTAVAVMNAGCFEKRCTLKTK